MKKKLLNSMRVLLVMAMLGVGAINAWADATIAFEQDFTAKGVSKDPVDYGFSVETANGGSVTVDSGIMTISVPANSSKDVSGSATATFDAIPEGNIITFSCKWNPGGLTGTRAYSQLELTDASGNSVLVIQNEAQSKYLNINGTTVIDNNNDWRSSSYDWIVLASLDMNTKKITSLSITKSGEETPAYSTTDLPFKNTGVISISKFVFKANKKNIYDYTTTIDDVVISYEASVLPSHDYTIYAVDAESNVLKELTKGSAFEGAIYTAKGLPYYILKDEKYYKINDGGVSGWAKNFEMGTADAVSTVSYALVNDIIAYTDASDANNSVTANENAEGGNIGQWMNKNILSVAVSKGIYEVKINNFSASGNTRPTAVDFDGTIIGSVGKDSWGETTIVIYANSAGTINVYGNASGNKATNNIDYVVVRKVSDITFALSDGEAKHLTFHNAGSASVAWDNWIMRVYDNADKKIELRADYWENVAGNRDDFHDTFVWSADGGITEGGNIWDTFNTSMQDADCDFTVSYTSGTVYIIGTATNANNVYYVNYSKSGFTGAAGIYLYGNNATLTNIVTNDAEVNTTWGSPSNAITATIGTTGWSTFASPYALDLSSMSASEGSVRAYYASSIGGSSVTMTSTESSAVAAGEGLMLKGTPSATITIPVVASGSAISGNKLVGVTSNTTITNETTNYANFYVLGINASSGKAEFQNLKNWIDEGHSVTINAGKAYLDATAAAPARLNIVFDDETSGISRAENFELKNENSVYNLQGQRVENPKKGLYIVNGKKVILNK